MLNSDAGKAQNVVRPRGRSQDRRDHRPLPARTVAGTGTSVESATAGLNQKGQWEIRPVFKDGADGIDKFNAAAAQCNPPSQTCPTGQIAIVLDNQVLTAPTIQVASFKRDQITISGSYKESEAKDIATALNYGALPVVLVPQTSEIVSATLGRDALHAGLIAGIVGFLLVGLYMIIFYRLLGVLAMFKLRIEGAILWAHPLLPRARSRAGAHPGRHHRHHRVDRCVARLQRRLLRAPQGGRPHRRTIRAAVDKSFASAWSTILAADGASIIGAALLWFLTVGRGARLRLLPRPLHRARPDHLVLLHAPGGALGHQLQAVPGAPGVSSACRPARSSRRSSPVEPPSRAGRTS